jgi:hypothetical protein
MVEKFPTGRAKKKAPEGAFSLWRRGAESNRPGRICNPSAALHARGAHGRGWTRIQCMERSICVELVNFFPTPLIASMHRWHSTACATLQAAL